MTNHSVVFIIAHKYFKGYTSYIELYVNKIRESYDDYLILIIDNNSVYKDEPLSRYYNDTDIIVLDNNIESKFEFGAYTVGLKYLLDNKLTDVYKYYVFSQDTFQLYKKYDFNILKDNGVLACPINSHKFSAYNAHIVRSKPILENFNLYNRLDEITFCWGLSFIINKQCIVKLYDYLSFIVMKSLHDRTDAERYFARILYELNNHTNYDIDGSIMKIPYNCHKVSFNKPGFKTYFMKYAQRKNEKTKDIQ